MAEIFIRGRSRWIILPISAHWGFPGVPWKPFVLLWNGWCIIRMWNVVLCGQCSLKKQGFLQILSSAETERQS